MKLWTRQFGLFPWQPIEEDEAIQKIQSTPQYAAYDKDTILSRLRAGEDFHIRVEGKSHWIKTFDVTVNIF